MAQPAKAFGGITAQPIHFTNTSSAIPNGFVPVAWGADPPSANPGDLRRVAAYVPASAAPTLAGKTAVLGGVAMVVGAVLSAVVPIGGAALGMVAYCNPAVAPGAGFTWNAYVSEPGFVSVQLICLVAGVPVGSAYNVRVVQ